MSSFEGVNNATDTLGGYGGTLTTGQKGTLTGSSDGVSVVYRTQLTGGNLIVRDGVGGTALTTINTAGTAGLHIWTSGALTDASRTIEIEASGGSVIVDGLYLHQYNRASGVRVWNCGRSGSRTQDYIDNAALGMDLINYFQSEGTLGAVLIGTGTNDSDSSGDGGASQLQDFYGDVRGASTTVPIFVWIPYINQVFTASEHAQRLAAAKGLTDLIIDGNALIPDFVGNPTWDAGDAVHLTSSAGLMIGQNMALAMSGDPFGQLQRQLRGAFLPLSGGTLTGDLTTTSVNATGTIAIQETATPKPSLHFIGAMVGALFGMGGATVRFGDSANDPDTNITRIGSGRLALNKSEGTLAANLSPYINAQTGTSYTLALTDAGKQITRNNSSASTQTFPQNSDAAIPVGTQIRIHNIGTGTVTLQAGTGATLVGDTNLPTNTTALVTKISTNGWMVSVAGGGTLSSLIVDEDDMVSDSDTVVPTQQSVKAYVDGLDSTSVKLTGNQTITGELTIDTPGAGYFKFFGEGGSPNFGLYTADANAYPSTTFGSVFGIPLVGFGPGTSTYDTVLMYAGAKKLTINGSEGTLAANLSPAINAQTGLSYTLALTDAGKQITRNNSAASTQTLPQNSTAAIPVGTQMRIHNIGTGTVTLQAGTGATLVGDTSLTTNKSALVTKISTNGWMASVAGGGSVTLLDEDNMASNSDTQAPTQQSVKAYVDGKAADRTVTPTSGGQKKIVSGGDGNAIASPVNTAQILGGGQTNYENVIGAASTANVGTASSNLPTAGSSNANYSTITGGYDNVANGLMTTLSGAHNIAEAASDHATISGGSFQKVNSGSYGTIGGGTAHTISANNATIAGGNTNTASGIGSAIGGGSNAVASGQGSAITGGLSNTASGNYSVVGGRSNTASAAYTRADGYLARAYTEGMEAHASGQFATAGDAQASRLVLRNTTTDATATILGYHGAAAHHQMPEPSSCMYVIRVVAREASTGDSKAWEIKGLAQNNTGGNVVLIGGAPTPTVIAASTNAASWTCAVATGGNALGVTATGEASKTIRWVATLEMVEVGA